MFLILLMVVLLAAPAWSQEKEWAKILASARTEGKVVVAGAAAPAVRQRLPEAFKAKFGIPLEFITARSNEMVARLRSERQAGISTIDVVLEGITPMVLYYNEKLLDPLKPTLMLPDVLDPSKWKKGKLWFDDPEQTHVLRLINSLGANFYVNSHSVKPGDLRFMKDLLTPKWKEKISFDDPTVPGKGNGTSTRLYFQMGEEAVKKLYMEQKPAISRDGRQLADWLARGTYPISFDAPSEEVKRLQKDGLPVGVAPPLSDFPGYVTSATGLVALMNKAPHSNAAKLFVNWIASQEGLQVFARAIEAATTRNDVDESFLGASEIPRPGVNYFDNGSWEYTLQKEKIRLWMKELLKR